MDQKRIHKELVLNYYGNAGGQAGGTSWKNQQRWWRALYLVKQGTMEDDCGGNIIIAHKGTYTNQRRWRWSTIVFMEWTLWFLLELKYGHTQVGTDNTGSVQSGALFNQHEIQDHQ